MTTIAMSPAAVALANLEADGFEHLLSRERDEFGDLRNVGLFTQPAAPARSRDDRGRFTARASEIAYELAG